MDAAGVPTKIGTIWAASASSPYVNTVPVPSQQAIANGRASFTDGFPPNCFIPYSSGGAGPFGGDTNGILQLFSQWLQWSQAGGPIYYDSAFATAIGGYPNGAIIQSATTAGKFWRCTADNNTSNPDTGGSNWVVFTTPLAAVAGDTLIANATGSTAVPTAIPAGNGLGFSGGALVVNHGNGLTFVGSQLATLLGAGLTFSGGAIAVNQSQSLSNPGWAKLPSGLIVQWGVNTITIETTITLPLTFPNNFFVVVITDGAADSWTSSNLTFYGSAISSLSTFGAYFGHWNGSTLLYSSGASATFNWIALGD